MIHIDGSHEEGGGQILRTALAHSALTGKPFMADRIRHLRPKPGLKNQHLTCIRALEQIANARATGAELGSAAVEFRPGKVTPGTFSIDIGTAGSISLLLQSVLLPCMFADDAIRLNLSGGTDTKWSIPLDYFSRLILPFFRGFGGIEIKKMRRGFYPRGRGVVDLFIVPRFHIYEYNYFADFILGLRSALPALRLTEKTELFRIQGVSAASQKLRKARVAERQIQKARATLSHLCPVDIEKEYGKSASDGSVITLWTVDKNQKAFIGGDALGERGKPAEKVGAEAAAKLLNVLNSDAVVDHHLADNLIPLLALVGGQMKTNKITGHIRSNIYVCQKFIDVNFNIDERKNEITAE
ncbi:MAG: RNA 3'-terminal phosphate cyclase [Desulfobacterales bacterium]|nr:MAG: RNA 3'-terminal phosphate cyclase [Desulfobacterales bacterium]